MENSNKSTDINPILKEDLAVWFGTKKKPKGSKQPKGPWVNICRKDENGKHPPCGRPDTSKGAYPKCRAAGVAGKMSDSQKKAACSQKRKAEKKDTQTGKGQKPVMTSYKPKKSKNEGMRQTIKSILQEQVRKSNMLELGTLFESREVKNIHNFSDIIEKLVKNVFIPISAGGGIRALEDAHLLFNSGADKIVLNSLTVHCG